MDFLFLKELSSKFTLKFLIQWIWKKAGGESLFAITPPNKMYPPVVSLSVI